MSPPLDCWKLHATGDQIPGETKRSRDVPRLRAACFHVSMAIEHGDPMRPNGRRIGGSHEHVSAGMDDRDAAPPGQLRSFHATRYPARLSVEASPVLGRKRPSSGEHVRAAPLERSGQVSERRGDHIVRVTDGQSATEIEALQPASRCTFDIPRQSCDLRDGFRE
jgi:hypothetical protein